MWKQGAGHEDACEPDQIASNRPIGTINKRPGQRALSGPGHRPGHRSSAARMQTTPLHLLTTKRTDFASTGLANICFTLVFRSLLPLNVPTDVQVEPSLVVFTWYSVTHWSTSRRPCVITPPTSSSLSALICIHSPARAYRAIQHRLEWSSCEYLQLLDE